MIIPGLKGGMGEKALDIQLIACLVIFLCSLIAFMVTMAMVSSKAQQFALLKEISRIACCYGLCGSVDNDDDDTTGCGFIHRCEATIEMSTHDCEQHHMHASSSSSSSVLAEQGSYQTYTTNTCTEQELQGNNALPLLDHHHHHDHPHDTIQELFKSNISMPLVLIRCMAAGIILGVAVMHLMADGQQLLQTQVSLATYPLGLLFMGVGIFITLAIDQIAMSSMANAIADNDAQEVTTLRVQDTNTKNTNTSSSSSSSNSSSSSRYGTSIMDRDVLSSEAEIVTDADRKALVKAYILEAGVAVHSVILGVGLGTMSKIAAIEVLLIVLIFHQALEGIGLGTVMAETCLSSRMKILFAIIFGLTLPMGTLIGIAVKQSASNSTQGDLIEGIMNTLAAGSLVYTSMVEMIASEFQFSVNAQKATGAMKGLMFLSLTGGFAIMSILAIWG